MYTNQYRLAVYDHVSHIDNDSLIESNEGVSGITSQLGLVKKQHGAHHHPSPI